MQDKLSFIDLTHVLSPAIPTWDGSCGFHLDLLKDYSAYQSGTKFRNQHIRMEAGIGTHMDAPAHCIAGGLSIADLPLSQLIAPCVVIDLSAQANESFSLSVKDIKDFETKYGLIPKESIVLIHTGWERFWPEPAKYCNHYCFPSVSQEAATYLLKRDIKGLGIDTLSPDRPESGFPVHQLLLGAGKYIIENVAHSKQLPPQGSLLLVLPIKIQGAAEAPIRLIGMVGK